ncbi:hypothetical protein BMS3Abin17_00078 [archaeon BMS3Abin17]|nr:hypothetical protein BMS3Abin17_00078 [archaeon BMS3Abin17]
MAEIWDFAISIIIILGFILALWARLSGQTIGELLRDMKDFFTDTAEDAGDIPYYE